MRTKKKQKKRFPNIRVGDTVQIISGKDKGESGKVLSIDWGNERILVAGVNLVTKHIKPNPRNETGGMEQKEAPIHYSNVLLYNSDLGRGVRTRIQHNGKERKRLCVKTAKVI